MTDYNEIRRTYTKLNGVIPCMLYEPRLLGEKSKTAVAMMHSGADYFEYYPALALAQRGYRVIVSNTLSGYHGLDEQIIHFGAVVEYIAHYPGVESVILLGHSGGATLISAYQAVAENGAQVFQGEEKNIPLGDVGSLQAAQAVMLLDPNLGNGAMTLVSLDPAIMDESNGRERDPKLDIFNPENGYDPEHSQYSDAFIRRFWRGQAARMNRLIDWAQERVRVIDSGKGLFTDDEPMIIPGGSQTGFNNKLFPQLTNFLSHTAGEWPLLHGDGSITVQVVPSVRSAKPLCKSADEMYRGALNTTVKAFLRSSSVRADEEQFGYDETTMHGVLWDSSYCCTVGNVAHISVPMLFMGMTGNYEYITAEHAYHRAVKCTDKTMAFVEGASHNFVAATEAETTPGMFGDTVKTCFDYVDKWIEDKFL